MKTTKGGKVMNPTDAYRKELRKKELKRNKKERKKVREVGILKKDPDVLKDQIDKLEMMKADGALDKARKHKKRQLEDTLNLVMKKRREYQDKMKEKGEPVMFSHLGPPRRLTSAEEEERAKHPKPEDSVYYHPTLNPTGAPPPGKPPMYKSSIGPRIPLSAASSSSDASSSAMESEDAGLPMPPPPPPPPLPPLTESNQLGSENSSVMPASLPLPPPPLPPKPLTSGLELPLPPLPPPPPGPPPKDQGVSHISLPPPPPPPLQQSAQPPPPIINEGEKERNLSTLPDASSSEDSMQALPALPPPPPPPGLPPNSTSNQSEGGISVSGSSDPTATNDNSKMGPPPPPPPQQSPVPGHGLMPTLQTDVLPPGISRLPPPPPPPNMRAQVAPGIPGQVAPSGFMVPLMPRPPYGLPPGPPPMMRPPLPPGPPPNSQEDAGMWPPVPQKPSYVKSAASTVVKRPLAHHNEQLRKMVPVSVKIKRETAVPKPKPRATISTAVPRPAAPTAAKPESANSSPSAPKTQSIDDSYSAFLEDMKALGALDS